MEDKKSLQDTELQNVTGGGGVPRNVKMPCERCGNVYWSNVQYPEGFLKSVDENSCGNTYHYKCPNCGYAWKDSL